MISNKLLNKPVSKQIYIYIWTHFKVNIPLSLNDTRLVNNGPTPYPRGHCATEWLLIWPVNSTAHAMEWLGCKSTGRIYNIYNILL